MPTSLELSKAAAAVAQVSAVALAQLEENHRKQIINIDGNYKKWWSGGIDPKDERAVLAVKEANETVELIRVFRANVPRYAQEAAAQYERAKAEYERANGGK